VRQLLNSPALYESQATDENVTACARYLDALDDALKPATAEQIGNVCRSIFAALSQKEPTPEAAKTWIVVLGDIPEPILRRAMVELLRESSYTPKPADLYRRSQPLMAMIRAEISAVKAVQRRLMQAIEDRRERSEIQADPVRPEDWEELKRSLGRALQRDPAS